MKGFVQDIEDLVSNRFEMCRSIPVHEDTAMDAHFRSFAQQVMPKLVEQGIAVLGMKSMC